MKIGEKIKINCKVDKCPVYAVALALNNLSGPDYRFSCPEQFCLYMREYPIVRCSLCEQDKNILICSLKDNKFVCAYCQEEVVNKKDEIKKLETPPEENKKQDDVLNKDIKIIETIKEKIGTIFKTLTEASNGYLYVDNFVFEQSDAFTFCNPQADDPNKGLLKVTKKELSQMSEKGIKEILFKFYDDVLQRYEKKDCIGCAIAEHYPNHIECTECSRNEQSASIQKVDKYVKNRP